MTERPTDERPAATPACEVRPVVAADMEPICAILNHFIRTSWVNFRTDVQTAEEVAADWRRHRGRYPWQVALRDGVLCGFAYAGPFKSRSAYDWCAEVTVYVAPEAARQGVARALYGHLIPTLAAQGFTSLVAVIALPNEPSVALHERCGFEHVGTLRRAGFKLGAWHDVGMWQRMLVHDARAPTPLVPVSSVPVPAG